MDISNDSTWFCAERQSNPFAVKTVTIPVEEFFTLPDGRPHYSFPLYVGDRGHDLVSPFVSITRLPIEKKG